ncbi:MAG: glycosyltransferase family 4 protein [bacterium]|nr:glycosyltransferase family 4 protein [bacterium]
MRILIITDSYPPELRSSAELMRELAIALQKRGHAVSVVTSSSKNETKTEDNVNVIRVRTLPHHDVSLILKGLSWILMPRLFWHAARKHCKKVDVAIVHSPPLTLAWVAEQAKKKYKAKYILNVQDIFPQNAIDLGVLKNKLIIKYFEKMERHAYKACDVIVTPSGEHKKYLVEKRGVLGEKIRVIYHWVDLKPFAEARNEGKFRKQFGLEDKFVVFFGGVMGPSQALDILIRLGKRVEKTHPDIVFLVCGNGSEKKHLVELKEKERVQNVYFEDWVPKEEYRALVKEMDVGLITLTAKNTTPAVPAKLMSYLAAGLPALGFLHTKSEAHEIIKDAKCGASAIYEDEDACLQALLSLYNNKARLKEWGENGRRYAEKNLAPEVCVEKWEKIMI